MISVCMATYNGAKYIYEQIDSILHQLEPGDELIISDDGSTDDTLNIINGFNDERIRVLRCTRPKKGLLSVNLVTTNFENALRAAKGDIIFMSDQDDVWLPNKVEIMLKYLESFDYAVSDCYITDDQLHIKSESRFYGNLTRNRFKALFSPTPWQGSCAAFRRKVLEKALPFPKKLQSHDRWIGYIGSLFYKSVIIDEPLLFYRRHDANTSTATNSRSNSSGLYKAITRLYYIKELIKRKLS